MPAEAAPWSVRVRLADAAHAPSEMRLEADAPARARIAAALDLAALHSLEAEVRLTPWMDGAQVEARWRARVVQTCGVSLEDFETDLAGVFEVRCVPPGSRAAASAGAEELIDPLAADPPDVLDDGAVDLGAYVVEHLALELDPFPRKPGVEFEPPQVEAAASPFAALAVLRPTPRDGSDA